MKTITSFAIIIVIIKTGLYIKKILQPIQHIPPPISVEYGLGKVKNPNQTYNLLNKKNVRFLLSPNPCERSDFLMVMVSSGPKNAHLRKLWREKMSDRQGEKIVFLIANSRSEEDQASLEREHDDHGDIVQCDIEDGHRLLGYKILCGHVWSYEHCRHVTHVAKTDDNVEVDVDRLSHVLKTDTSTDWENLITCPTLCYSMKVIRSTSGGMTGNWSHSKEEIEHDIMPDFCVGFLSLTTPDVGAQLAQVGLVIYGDSKTPVTQIEDSLITGILRERLPHIRIKMMELGPRWERIFTWCPWLHVFKQTFMNDLIISKKSSRNNVEYVGGITNPNVWKFFLCLMVEGGLGIMEEKFPTLMPSFIWGVCAR